MVVYNNRAAERPKQTVNRVKGTTNTYKCVYDIYSNYSQEKRTYIPFRGQESDSRNSKKVKERERIELKKNCYEGKRGKSCGGNSRTGRERKKREVIWKKLVDFLRKEGKKERVVKNTNSSLQ